MSTGGPASSTRSNDVNAEGGILGCEITVEFQDTQADPDISKQVVAEGVEKDPYAILGTVFSSSTIVNMVEAQRAEIPQFVGAEAPSITNREENGDNDFIFRTAFGGDNAAPKLVAFMLEEGVGKVDIIFKNDEFGAGGAEAHKNGVRGLPASRSARRSSSSPTRSTCRVRSASSPAPTATPCSCS